MTKIFHHYSLLLTILEDSDQLTEGTGSLFTMLRSIRIVVREVGSINISQERRR